MAVPYLKTEVQFASPTWTDISPYVRSARIQRGSTRVDSPTVRYEAGTAELVLDNRDRRFDPTNLNGPYTESFTTDTGTHKFKNAISLFYGIGLTVNVKSATGKVASVVNVSSRASGTTSSYSVPRPAGTASGHKMILIQFFDVGDAVDASVSGGSSWTPITGFTLGTDTIQCVIWHKTAGGSEPFNYTVGQSSGTDGVAIVLAIRDADLVTTPAVLALNNSGNALFITGGQMPFDSNDLDIRCCGGSPWGMPGSTWTADDPMAGFTKYADRQSQIYTAAAVWVRSLSGVDLGGGSTSNVTPMRPVRITAEWSFTPTTNLIQNPSFELGTTGWSSPVETQIRTVDQFGWIGGDSLELTRLDTQSPFNLYSATCSAVGSGGATSGQTVTISAYVYVPAASYPKVTGYVILANGIPATFVDGPPAPDMWHRITLTATLTATLGNVQFQFWTDDTHSDGQVIAYIDGVQAEVKPTATPYCDGDQPGCSWAGSAHNSNSTRPASVSFPLFHGFVDDWNISWTANVDSEVIVPCTDGFKVLGAIDRAALSSPVGDGEMSHDRVNRILDSANWPVGARIIGTGSSQMRGTTLPDSPLTELFLVSDSELGEFYMDASGNAVFRGRTGILQDTRSTNPQARFGDGGEAAGELMYQDVEISNDDTQLYNEARIARTGGSQQTATDPDSITKFLTHTFERTDLELTSDAESLAYAQWIVYISKDPELRFDKLIIKPQKDEDRLFPQVLKREIGDRIRVTRRPPDVSKPDGVGDPVVREAFIRGIEFDIQQYDWTVSYTLQSATKVGSFLTLDHPVLGRIGRNALRF